MGSHQEAIVLFCTICAIGVFTHYGLTRSIFQDKFIFDIGDILARKQYYRLITSGFLHADWIHFAFNAWGLYILGGSFELRYGAWLPLLVFVLSIIGGCLFTLWVHRNHEYRALGASGGVYGILFMYLLFYPDGYLQLMFIPITMPAWLFGTLLLGLSILAIIKQYGGVCHEGHVGGAMTGLLMTGIMFPKEILNNSKGLFAVLAGMCLLLLYYCYANPLFLPFKFAFNVKRFKKDPQINDEADKRLLDEILFKVSCDGIGSLSKKEKKELERLSKKYRK